MSAAMILAAGRGERLRPLTDHTPKSLIDVGGEPLITRHIRALSTAGANPIVINVSYHGEQIRNTLGDGEAFGTQLHYSQEPEPPLETGGGIFRALSLLGPEPFWVVNADIYTDYPFAPPKLADNDLAHLVLVDNPEHHRQGDFHLNGNRAALNAGARLTFSGIGIYRPQLFEACVPEAFPLAPLLREAMGNGRVSAERYSGCWIDVGTPERLKLAREHAANTAKRPT